MIAIIVTIQPAEVFAAFSDAVNAQPGVWGAALLAAGLAALTLALSPVLAHRRHRREAWIDAPEELLEAPPSAPARATLACVAGVATAVLTALVGPLPFTAIAAIAAAAACLTVGHVTRRRRASVLGLLAGAVAFATLGAALLARRGLGDGVGLAFYGAILLWLAWFWRRQLRDGQPWTTAGRIIPETALVGAASLALGAGLIVFSLRA